MSATDPISDQRLVVLLRQGDLTALETLFARHSAAIYGFFYRTTGSAATGEDLTQEVFLRVLRYHSSFKLGKMFRVWLYGIARNVLSDHRARPMREETMEEIAAEPLSTEPLPTERIERREDRALIHAALARLQDPDRELLMLSRFHDLRHAELAELYGCKVGAIKVRIHRALNGSASSTRPNRRPTSRAASPGWSNSPRPPRPDRRSSFDDSSRSPRLSS
jgi:RNA polymerase sigma-70 factor (ECF subfamily)